MIGNINAFSRADGIAEIMPYTEQLNTVPSTLQGLAHLILSATL